MEAFAPLFFFVVYVFYFVFCFLSLPASLMGSAARLAAGCQDVVRHLCAARKPAEGVRATILAYYGRRRCARPPSGRGRSRPPVASRRGASRSLLTRLRHRPIVIIDMHKALAEEWSTLMRTDARKTRCMCNAASGEAILRRSDSALLTSVGVIAAAHLASICVASPRISLHSKRHEGRDDDRRLCEFLGSLRKKHCDGHATIALCVGRILSRNGRLILLLQHVSPVRLIPGEDHGAAQRDFHVLTRPRTVILDVHSMVAVRFTRAEGAVPDSPVTVVRQFGRHDGRLLLVQICEVIRHSGWMCRWMDSSCLLSSSFN